MDGDDTVENAALRSAWAMYRDFRSVFLWFGFSLVLAVTAVAFGPGLGHIVGGLSVLIALAGAIGAALSPPRIARDRRREGKQDTATGGDK